MVFSSPTFLFYFIPIVLLIAFLTQRNRLFILIASLIFYAWGEPIYIFLLIAVILFNNYFGQIVSDRRGGFARLLFAVGVGADIIALVTFKYSDFLVSNLNSLLTALSFPSLAEPHLPLPLGISFFTFQAIAYLSDIYTGKLQPSRSLLRFAVFKSFFPQLIAGPIVRYQWVVADLERDNFNERMFAYGIDRFVIGLAKKVIIADNIAPVVDQLFSFPANQLSLLPAWVAAVGFALQIYFDFSGYSDMAIGMGRMFGIRFPENFRHPYAARSVQDFWRRWHITLSTWFRDYLYIPLGGNRRGPVRTYFNLFLVFFLCGLWHGAMWTFVAWGLYHGFFLVLERTPFGRILRRLPGPIQHLYLLAAVAFGWVLFRSPSLAYAVAMMGAMIGLNGIQSPQFFWETFVSEFNSVFLLIFSIGVIASVPWAATTRSVANRLRGRRAGRDALAIAYPATLAVLLLGSFAFVAAQSHFAFIYFRF